MAVSRMLHEFAGTREHPFKLHKKTVLTIQYAIIIIIYLFLTNRVINKSNSLPSNIVLARTLDSFKNVLYEHWKHNR